MAFGEPFTTVDGDRYLYQLLAPDSILRTYLPGEPSSEQPTGETLDPLARYWRQDRRPDRAAQDGRQSRVVSTPTYIVVALDRQKKGESDRVFGTLGGSYDPPRPYLELAQKRLYSLLHGRQETVNGFRWTLDCFDEYSVTDPTEQGYNDVLVGWWVRMTVT